MSKCMMLFAIMTTLLFSQHHFVVSSSYNATTTDLSPNMQKLALFQFRHSLAINTSAPATCNTPELQSWSMSSDHCTWEGVTCNNMTRDVIELDLSCGNLVGPIPSNSTLFQLTHLQYLDFSLNDLHGAFPEEIFHLPNLKQLSLLYNSNLIVSLPKVKWGSSSSLQSLSLTYINTLTSSGGIPDSIGYLNSLTYLSLSNCNFSGPIPISIGNLTQLTVLDLSLNNLNGHIPRSIGNLTQLTDLNLNFNQLSGQIPDTLANIHNLTFLSLGGNYLIGQFPSWIANLTQLESLTLLQNSLTGPLPTNFNASCLPKLTVLYVGMNLLNGTIPSWLFDLPLLTELSIAYNRFTGQLNGLISYRSSLKVFHCNNNLLNGTIPQSFSEYVNLTDLNLSSNNFSGVLDIEMFSQFQNLYMLDLSNNNLSLKITSTATLPPKIEILRLASCKIKEITDFFKTAEMLVYLDLSNNQIHGEIPHWIREASWFNLNISNNFLTGGLDHLPWNILYQLDLHSNLLNGSLPATICNSSSLEILNLSHNNLTGVLPICSGTLNYSLSVLDVRMNNITGSLPPTLSNFRKLRSLNLYSNKLEGTIPLSFAELDYLEVLDLGSNQIKDTFPQWLEALQNLQVLSLKSNKLHGIINNVSKLEHPFPSLRIIDLSDNEFSGPLPAKYFENFKGMMNSDEKNKMERSYIGDYKYSDTLIMVIKGVSSDFVRILTTFTTIDLSGNNFEGEIPEFIGNLKSLRYLNLSHNHLSGHIPPLLGKLSMLESLDLSSNRLVGFIPQELKSLTFLSHLNLSYNDLNGHIPVGAQFETFDTDSYIGNLALCGRPLSKRCDRYTSETQENADEDDVFTETQENANEDDDYFFSGFTWKSVMMGYGSGLVVGFIVGYVMFMTREPKWFTRIIAKKLDRKVRRVEIRRFA